MFKNVSGQKLTVFAFDAATNLPMTGDAANITAYVSKDGGSIAALADTSATEKDATNAEGYYEFDVAQAESNADKLLFTSKSSTANIVVIAVPAVVYTLPQNFTAASITSGGVFSSNVPANGISATSIATNALNGKCDWFTAAQYQAPDNDGIAAAAASASTAASAATSALSQATQAATSAASADTKATGIKAKTDNLPTDPASNTNVNTRLAASSYAAAPTASQNATAVAAQTNIAAALTTINTNLDAKVSEVSGGGGSGDVNVASINGSQLAAEILQRNLAR